MKTYSGKGIVWGHLWGGGTGGYPSKKLTAETREALVAEAEQRLKDGSLDGGMGFESLYGAVIVVVETEVVVIEGKEFTHTDREFEILGKLSEEELDKSCCQLLDQDMYENS